MANLNTPQGLTPINDNGTPWSGQGRLYYVPSSVGTNIFVGDPLLVTGGSDAYGVPSIGLATAGATHYVTGVMVGVANGPAAGANATSTVLQSSTIYHPASTAGYILVCDDPNTLFTIQEDSVGGALSTTAASGNANLIAGSGGSTATGLSSWMLDSSSLDTDATFQLRIMQLLREPDNVIGDYAKWVVRLNLAQTWHTLGIVGS